jgi:hypothetical protein
MTESFTLLIVLTVRTCQGRGRKRIKLFYRASHHNLSEHALQIGTQRLPSDNASPLQSWLPLPRCKFLARVHGNQNDCSCISFNDVPGAAMECRVVWEIDIDAEGLIGTEQSAFHETPLSRPRSDPS